MTRFLIAAFLLLLSPPAIAACVPVETARAQLAEAIPGAVVTELAGAELKVAGQIFNAIPPESTAPVETAAMIDLPNGGGALAVGPNGQICAVVSLPPEQWKAFRLSVLGRGA